MGKKITYLIGAGASFGAIPLNDELSDDMICLPSYFDFENPIGNDANNSDKDNPHPIGTPEYLMFEIVKLGYKSREFESVDNYAQALMNNANALAHLKMVISIYFALAQKIGRSVLFENKQNQRNIRRIDPRIYELITKCIDIEKKHYLKTNVNFITWNYDLQIELAFKRYLETSLSKKINLPELNGTFLQFYPTVIPTCIKQQVFHLNGFTGLYQTAENVIEAFIGNDQHLSSQDYIKRLAELSILFNEKKLHFDNQLKFSYESYRHTTTILNDVISSISDTDVLIIIGYSFPAWNSVVDRTLLQSIYKKNLEIRVHSINEDIEYYRERMALNDSMTLVFKSINEFSPPQFFETISD